MTRWGGGFRSAAADLRFWVGRNGDSWPANHAKGRERGKGFLNDLSGWKYLRGLGMSLRVASGDMPKLRSWSWIIRHFEVVWLQDGSHRDTRSLLCGGLCRSDFASRWPPSSTPTISECWTLQPALSPPGQSPGRQLKIKVPPRRTVNCKP